MSDAKKPRGGLVGGAAKAGRGALNAISYAFIGDRKAFVDERKQNFALIRAMAARMAPVSGRKETFQDAMDRQGLGEDDLAAIDASLSRQGRIYAVALAMVGVVFCMLPWVAWPLSHLTLCLALAGYCGAILLRVRFRHAQVRARELFTFGVWLQRFWGGKA